MNSLKTVVIAFVAGLAGAFVFFKFQEHKSNTSQSEKISLATDYNPSSNYQTVLAPTASSSPADNVDFSHAAARTTPSVVYINSISQSGVSYSYFDLLFGGAGQQTQQVSSGSGVIFSSDGYIVTNNHVVESAEKIQVLYNKKSYEAELIGTDPSTDLAVLKIKETNLPAITLGSSKNLLLENG